MKLSHYLWALWGVMILSMILKWRVDPYMMVALIIIPILIVLMELHEEVQQLKEEAKHQRKFVMDRYTILSDKVNDISAQVEKKLVVDFSEFARENPPPKSEIRRLGKKKKKKTPAPDQSAPETPPEDEDEFDLSGDNDSSEES